MQVSQTAYYSHMARMETSRLKNTLLTEILGADLRLLPVRPGCSAGKQGREGLNAHEQRKEDSSM